MKSLRRSLTTFAFALLLPLLAVHAYGANPHCSAVGGAILTNLGGFGQIDGWPTTMGVATGDLKGAIGVQIVAASPDFTSITVQHHWVTDAGETLSIDSATLYGAYVTSTLLGVKEYKAHLSGGTGRFEHATGDMSFMGEIDLGSGQVVLRYSGRVCTTANE